ncbi:hypothetical protein DID88_005938 [Monilinia fructigena]|uniref:Uncharacterized protein n=1 Tax=Monilinia fructigena TaxID=38457 RepID=A0A395J188_9HELO|nr:hypothetical protein DID88_005938 [Monilinia fructigena]
MVNLPSRNDKEPKSEPSSRPRSRERANSKGRHTRSSSAVAKSEADEFSGLTPAEAAERLQTSLISGLTPAAALAIFKK